MRIVRAQFPPVSVGLDLPYGGWYEVVGTTVGTEVTAVVVLKGVRVKERIEGCADSESLTS